MEKITCIRILKDPARAKYRNLPNLSSHCINDVGS